MFLLMKGGSRRALAHCAPGCVSLFGNSTITGIVGGAEVDDYPRTALANTIRTPSPSGQFDTYVFMLPAFFVSVIALAIIAGLSGAYGAAKAYVNAFHREIGFIPGVAMGQAPHRLCAQARPTPVSPSACSAARLAFSRFQTFKRTSHV